MKKATFTIEDDLIRAVKQFALDENITLTKAINIILKRFFKGKK